MGEVDNSDGINVVAYSIVRKTLNKYYKKIFHLLEIISLNAYMLYKKNNGKLTCMNFLLEYIEKIYY